MKQSVLSLSLLALALCAGCADTYYASQPYAQTTTVTTTHTIAMGAGPVVGTVCQDGSLMPPNSACLRHGGVDRQTTYSSAFPRY